MEMYFQDEVRRKMNDILVKNYSEDIKWLNEMSKNGLENKVRTRSDDMQK